MRTQIGAAIAMLLFAIEGIAWAHGVVGDYTFLEPIVAEDANPKNEFDILAPRWIRTAEGRQFSLGFSLEKKISDDSSVTIGSSWSDFSPKQGRPVSGFDNLDLMLKYAVLTLDEHEMRISGALEMSLPTGNPSAGAETHFRLGPEILWAKGMGDLPSRGWIKYLRPLGLQGDVGYTSTTTGRTNHDLFADEVIEYSIPYLSNSVSDFGLRWPLRNIYLYSEFNYDELIAGPPGTTFPAIFATPGIAYMDYYVELSLATQFALNRASVRENHAAILGLVDVFIDDIFPITNWTPL